MLPIRDHLSTRTAPIVNWTLIAANVLVFGLEVASAGDGHIGKPSPSHV